MVGKGALRYAGGRDDIAYAGIREATLVNDAEAFGQDLLTDSILLGIPLIQLRTYIVGVKGWVSSMPAAHSLAAVPSRTAPQATGELGIG